MKTKQSIKEIIPRIRHIYILLYMVVVAFAEMIPVRQVIDGKSGMVYNAVAGVGVLLFLAEMLLNPSRYKNWNGILRLLFLCAIVISSVVNIQYGVVDNVKTLCWTGIQIIVLTAIDTDLLSTEQILRQFRQFSETFSLIWTAGVAVSLGQFVVQYSVEVFLTGSSMTLREGFVEARLFGVFPDPNYAAMCSCAVIFFAIANMILGKKKTLGIIYHILLIFMQLSYVILSGSRTAEIGVVVTAFAVALLLAINFGRARQKKTAWKILVPIGCACLAVVVCVGGWKLVKAGYSHVPGLYASISGEEESKKEELEKEAKNLFVRDDVKNSNDISNNRFTIWKDYIEVLKSTPVVGTSPRNTLAYTADHFDDLYVLDRQYSVHNTYLALFVCTGLLGGSIMLLWLVLTAIRALRYLAAGSQKKPNYRIVLILTCIMLIDAMAALPLKFMFFSNTAIDIVFWTTLGFLMALIQKDEKEITQ